jgi:mannose-6-phosphate isomerase-like protein (cupin superfamily)
MVKETHMIHTRPGVNEFELIQVMDQLKQQGITHATIQPGNDCVWVSHGLVNCYYIFREGRIVDVQVD